MAAPVEVVRVGLGSSLGALLMGATFTLTSVTCTAPFVGTLLVLASQGVVQTFEPYAHAQLVGQRRQELGCDDRPRGDRCALHIERLERVSKSSLRQYKGKDELPKILAGLGVAIISTSQGLMTDRQARAAGVGGEVLCLVA